MSPLQIILIILALFSLIAPAMAAVGLYIPLYMYPDSNWLKVIEVKKTYPKLPIIAIINPDSGPGTAVISSFNDYINRLLATGIIVHGYDRTSEGNRAIDDVKADIDRYKNFYPQINGIFFDEMATTAGSESYYTELTAYAASKGFIVTDGNPGTNTPSSYANTVNIFLISETEGTIDLGVSSSWPTRDRSRIALMANTVSILPKGWVKEACKVSDWLYITNEIEPDPYHQLPVYFTDLAKLINDKCNGNGKSKLGMILGIVFGVLGGLAIAVGVFFGVRRYKLKKNDKKAFSVINHEGKV